MLLSILAASCLALLLRSTPTTESVDRKPRPRVALGSKWVATIPANSDNEASLTSAGAQLRDGEEDS
jgi:hypothetical protein